MHIHRTFWCGPATAVVVLVVPWACVFPSQALAEEDLQRVEISGKVSVVSDALTGAQRVSGDDLFRHGGHSLSDALRRLPGVTVVSAPGEDPQISLGGLGRGRTLVLVNGEPLQGKTLDALTSSQVAFVEIKRNQLADSSAQAIAGTINIVLKEIPSERTAEGTAGLSLSNTRLSPRLTLSAGNEESGVGVSATLTGRSDGQRETKHGTLSRRLPVEELQTSVEEFDGRSNVIAFAPRVQGKFSDGSALVLDVSLQATQNDDRSGRTTAITTDPDAAQISVDSVAVHRTSNKGTLGAAYMPQIEGFDTVSLKCSIGGDRRRAHAVTILQGIGAFDRVVSTTLRDTVLNCYANAEREFGKAHRLKAGIDVQDRDRSESRIQSDKPDGSPRSVTAAAYAAQIGQGAVFVQDEYAVDPRASIYFGIRNEYMMLRANAATDAPILQRKTATSPVLRLLLRDGDDRTLSLGWSRTYRPPSLRDLIPRPWMGVRNSPTSPYFRGNPALQPELADTFDALAQLKLASRSALELRLTHRQIDHMSVDQVYQEAGVWYESPVNVEEGTIRSAEVVYRDRLGRVFPSLADIDLAATVVRTIAKMHRGDGFASSVPGTAPWSLDLSLDRKLADGSRFGANLQYKRGTFGAAAPEQSVSASSMRSLGVYAAVPFRPSVKFRISLSRLLQQAQTNTRFYSGIGAWERYVESTEPAVAMTVQLDMSL